VQDALDRGAGTALWIKHRIESLNYFREILLKAHSDKKANKQAVQAAVASGQVSKLVVKPKPAEVSDAVWNQRIDAFQKDRSDWYWGRPPGEGGCARLISSGRAATSRGWKKQNSPTQKRRGSIDGAGLYEVAGHRVPT
jgi:hypothetical protein